MLALIIITGIVLYAFLVIVVFWVTLHKLEQRCGCDDGRWCVYDHSFSAGFMAVFWPGSFIVVGLGLGLYRVATGAAEWVIDKTSK